MKNTFRPTAIGAFEDADKFLRALDRFQGISDWRLRTYSPHPLEAVEEKLEPRPSPIPRIVFAAFVTGALGGYLLQVYVSVFAYRINVGGRPLHSWPAFLPVIFELGVLTAALAGLVSLFIRRRWPKLYVPDLDSPLVSRGSHDRYVLALMATNSNATADTLEKATATLRELGASETEVHRE